nr:MFS transporter [uncultured Dethiosulfovibrio sp.]
MALSMRDHPLVRFPDFRRFFAARFVSSIGDKFFTIALSWWAVNDAGPNGPMHLGFLMGLTLLPAVVLGPISGVMADRFSRWSCMILSDFARLLVMVLMTFLLIKGSMSIPAMYVLVLLLSSFMPLFEAAANGSLEALTDQGSLASAAAVNSSVVELSNVIGAALGGIALAVLGTAGAFGINGVTFCLSLLFLCMVKNPLRPDARPSEGRMSEALSWLVKNRDVLGYLCLFGGLNFFAAPLMVSVPMMVKFGFDGPVSWVAYLEASLASGAVLTAFLVSFISEGKVSLRVFGGVALTGLSLGAFGLSPGLTVALVAVFVAGAGLALVNAAAMAYFQRRVPDHMRGRFFAVLTAVAYSVMPLALMLNGVISQIWSIRFILALDGAVVFALGFFVWLIPNFEP